MGNSALFRGLVVCAALLVAPQLWATAEAEEAGADSGGIVEITGGFGNWKWNDYPDNPVSQYIQDTLGVKYVRDGWRSGDEKAVRLASGDLPDMFIIEAFERAPLQEAGYILPLNDLIEQYGPNIKKTAALALPFVAENWADENGLFYGLPGELMVNDPVIFGQYPSLQLCFRWDLYKEIGTPKLTTIDDIVAAAAEMVRINPQTDEGLRVYGIGGRVSNLWGLTIPMSAWYGYQNTETWGIVLDNRTTDPVENYYNTDSPLWRMAEFYYKQNQAGILDPDTLIARERSELAAKMAKGQYVGMTIRAGGFARAWDAIHAKEGRGLVAVPIEGGGIWGGQDLRFGSANFRTISAKAQDKIEAVMRLFDWGFSEHGMRTLSTGVEGIHWDFVDGKGSVRQMTLDLRAAGGEDWSATGIDMLGWGANTQGYMHSDGQPVQLFNTDEAVAKLLNATDLDYAQYYGVQNPEGHWNNYMAAGTIATAANLDYRVIYNMPLMSDEMRRIDSEVNTLVERRVPQIVLAASDAEFRAGRDQLIADIRNAGYDQIRDWYVSNYNRLKTEMGPKPPL